MTERSPDWRREMIDQARKWPRSEFGEGYWFNAMADEIESLTADRDSQQRVCMRVMTERDRLKNSLTVSGFTDCGGEIWKPPLGKRYDIETIDRLRELLEWLDRRGGLGIDVHERIRAALSGAELPQGATHE
jgi:hypothetical protein